MLSLLCSCSCCWRLRVSASLRDAWILYTRMHTKTHTHTHTHTHTNIHTHILCVCIYFKLKCYRKVLHKSRGLCALFQLFGQASIRDRLICKTGLCAAVVQLLAVHTVQSMHAGIQHLFVLYVTSHTINSIKSRFCKPRLLFESGFYSRVAFIQDYTVYAHDIIICTYRRTYDTRTVPADTEHDAWFQDRTPATRILKIKKRNTGLSKFQTPLYLRNKIDGWRDSTSNTRIHLIKWSSNDLTLTSAQVWERQQVRSWPDSAALQHYREKCREKNNIDTTTK